MSLRPVLLAAVLAALACDRTPDRPPLRVETINSNLLPLDTLAPAALVEQEGATVAAWIMDSRAAASDTALLVLDDGRRLRVLVDGSGAAASAPLTLTVSSGDSSWIPAVVLDVEAVWSARPAIMRALDGTVHVTYALDAQRFRHLALRLR